MSFTVAQLVARLTADTSGFYRGMAVANSSMIRTGGIISRVAAGAGIATLGMGIMSLRAAGSFEQSMNILQAVTSANTKGFNAMRTEAIALGRDMKLPNVSAKDAAESMLELAKGGLSVQQSIKATRGTLQLGLAANIAFSESAVIVARALQAFGLQGKDATRVADLFTAASVKSTASMTDIALGFQMASAQFKAGDQTIQGLTTSLALMANAGIVGSDAGTSLKTMMNRLMAPTKKASDLMNSLGIEIYNSNGNMKPMPALIGEFNKAMSGMSKEQRNAALYTIFGSDAIRAARVQMDAGTSGWNKMAAAITKGGEAQAYAEAQTKGFNGAVQALWSQIETLAIELGTALLPAATAVTRAMADFVAGVDPEKIIAFFTAIKDGIVWIYNLIAGSDLLQYSIAALVGAFVTFKIISTVIGMVKALQVAWALLNASFVASPLGMLALAIGALVAALVLAYIKSETFRNIVNSAFRAIRDVAVPVMQAVRDAVSRFFDWVGPRASSVLNAVVGFFRTHWNTIRSVTQTVWGIIQDVVRIATFGIRNVVLPVLSAIVGAVRTHWGTISSVTSTVWNVIVSVIRTAVSVIRTIVGTIIQIVGIVRNIFNQVVNAVRNPMETVKTVVRTAINAIPGILTGIVGAAAAAAGQIGSAIFNGIVGGLSGLASSLASKVTGAIGGMFSAAKGFIKSGSPSKRAADEIGKPIGEGIILGFLNGTTDLPDKVSDRIKNALEAGKKQVDAARSMYTNAFSQLASDALSAFDAVTRAFETPSEKRLNKLTAQREAAERKKNVEDAKAAYDALLAAKVDYNRKEEETDAEYNARIAEAEKKLREEQASALKTWEDAKWEIQKFNLQRAAETEDREYQARRDLQRRHLEAQLAEYEAKMMAQPERADFWQKKITATLRAHGVNYKSAGELLGKAFARGMRESFAEVERTAEAMARLVAKYLRLKSPADEGPLSDLDGWWKGFASTLVSSLNSRDIEAALAGLVSSRAYAAPSFRASSAGMAGTGGRGGGSSTIIYVGGSVLAERELLELVRKGNTQGTLQIPGYGSLTPTIAG